MEGCEILLCDLDPQGAASFYFRIRPGRKLNKNKFLKGGKYNLLVINRLKVPQAESCGSGKSAKPNGAVGFSRRAKSGRDSRATPQTAAALIEPIQSDILIHSRGAQASYQRQYTGERPGRSRARSTIDAT